MANWLCTLHAHVTTKEAVDCAWERNKQATRLAAQGIPPEQIRALLGIQYMNMPAMETGGCERN